MIVAWSPSSPQSSTWLLANETAAIPCSRRSSARFVGAAKRSDTVGDGGDLVAERTLEIGNQRPTSRGGADIGKQGGHSLTLDERANVPPQHEIP